MEHIPFAASFRNTFRSLASPNNTGGYLSSVSSYYEHPPVAKSAVDDYGPLKAKAESASLAHESNSKAVLTALKGLKEKIRKLEDERDKADRNLKSLAVETSEYKDMLQKEHCIAGEKHFQIEDQNRDLERQLKGVEQRCRMLEEQLTRMREVSQSISSTSPPNAMSKVHFSTEAKPGSTYFIHDRSPLQLEKLADLEKEHLKLTLSHSITENKIRELQEKLREEKHQRKLLQDKAVELQTMAESNRILLSLSSPREQRVKPVIKRKKTIKKAETTSRKVVHKSPVAEHYHLDFKKIPFVVGRSTGESYSLGANMQNVLSMMKSHNPVLCGNTSRRNTAPKSKQRAHSSEESSSDSSSSLTELLSALQDEFGRMGFEHSELVKTIQETEDETERFYLEKELKKLVLRMEAKGEQISLLKHHREKHRREKKSKTKESADSKPVKRSQHHRNLSLKQGEVEVVTTVKSRTSTSPKYQTSQSSNLEKFRQVKKLQTSLQKEDLSWD